MASIITGLFSGGAGTLLTGVSKVIDSIRGKSPEDAAKLAELSAKYESEFLAAQVQMNQMQADINKVEAGSSDKYTSRWRPTIGYVCGMALFFEFIVRPLFTWIASLAGHPEVVFPALDMGDLVTILLGMLGLGAARTIDKINGKG